MTKLTPESAQEIITLLGKQLSGLKTMLDILQQEYHALEKNDLQTFDDIVNKKQLQTHALGELETEFKPLINIMGGTIDRKSIEKFIGNLADQAVRVPLQATWNDLLQTLNQCHDQNKANHRILESSKISVQQALDILRGESSIPKLYSSSGKQHTGTQGHSLAVA